MMFVLVGCKKQPKGSGVDGRPSPLASKARGILAAKGCLACHSVDGTKRIGPSLKGIYGKPRVVLTAGKERTVIADEAYLKRAMLKPRADVVKAYRHAVMLPVPLTPEQVQTLVAYIKSLR